jgi:DNA-binding MurR/RpiR family transcriptional regulator
MAMTQSVLDKVADLLAAPDNGLPATRREVLELVRSDPERVLTESFEALAERSGSSVPTIMRTVRDLGYAGLREFKLALAQALAVGGSPLHRRVALDDSTEQVMAKVIKSAAAAVNGVQAQLSTPALEAAAEAMVRASRVDCWSVGATSSFMASDFQARLFRMGLVSNAYLDQHLQLVSAATLNTESVAFAISHVGGMPSLLDAVGVAKGQGATVVALTQAGTPLARQADIVLGIHVPEDPVMHVGTEAYLAHLTVIEILTVLIAQRLGDSAVERLRNVRDVLSTHGLDTRNHPVLRWGEPE